MGKHLAVSRTRRAEGRRRHLRTDRRRPPIEQLFCRVEPVPLSALEPATVIWAPVPFRELDGHKSRPCVVLAHDRRTVTVWPILSSPARLTTTANMEVVDWLFAGLSRPSGVRRVAVELDRREVIDVVGELSERDRVRLGLIDEDLSAGELVVA